MYNILIYMETSGLHKGILFINTRTKWYEYRYPGARKAHVLIDDAHKYRALVLKHLCLTKAIVLFLIANLRLCTKNFVRTAIISAISAISA
jgi:hypothetical protein